MSKLFESNNTELKRELNDKLEKNVVAFLNSKTGGDIYIGVEDDGSIVGVKDIDQTQLTITSRIKDNILPTCLGLFDVYTEEIESQKVIHIVVSSGTEKPYYLKATGMSPKGCFARVGSSTQPMDTNTIESYLHPEQETLYVIQFHHVMQRNIKS
ncbi:MAG: ATP-binding protein [Candidatus Caenarcaniphilales bacterium]|nr:ATP-binding protein [Candidatus Caenarcaniphilales bacterium]